MGLLRGRNLTLKMQIYSMQAGRGLGKDLEMPEARRLTV
jgi:hypothetical protein